MTQSLKCVPCSFPFLNPRPQRTSTPNDDDHFLLALYVYTAPVLSKGEPFPGGEEQPYLFRCWLPSEPPAEFLSVGGANNVLWMNKSVMNECPQLGTATAHSGVKLDMDRHCTWTSLQNLSTAASPPHTTQGHREDCPREEMLPPPSLAIRLGAFDI